MYYEAIQLNDSLKTISDTAAAVTDAPVVKKITFDIFNIGADSLIISFIGYTIVFIALVVLFLALKYLSKGIQYSLRKKLKAEGHHAADKELEVQGSITAAISMALILHFQEIHDFENTVITIKKVRRPYSPWSSKLYGLRQPPLRK